MRMRSYKDSGPSIGWYLFCTVYVLVCVGVAFRDGWGEALRWFFTPPLALACFVLGGLFISGAIFLLVYVPYFLILYGIAEGIEKIKEQLRRLTQKWK